MSITAGEKNTIVKSYPAVLEHLYEMLKFIRGYSESIGFSRPQLLRIEVALEEAIVNIISYGFSSEEVGNIEISCGLLENKGIKIVLKDEGIAYNPVADEKQVKERSQDQIGGYGVKLILEIMDEVIYSRQAGKNVLTLVKYK